MPRSDDDDRDEPVRKKKKKKKKKAKPAWKMYAGIGGGVVGLIVLVFIIAKVFGGKPLQPVTAFDKFSSEDNEFGFEYPANWKAKEYGKSPNREAIIKSGSSSIEVKENLVGSLVADIAGAIGNLEADDERSRVGQVHEMRKPKDSSSYKEGPAVTVMSKFGKVRRSEYKDGSLRGYRATAVLRQSALDIFCNCHASNWDILRPAFERMIESLGPGEG